MSSFRIKVLLLLTALGVTAVYAVAFLLSTTNDRVDQLDTDAMKRAARPACLTLRADLDALAPLAPGADAEQRRARVGEQTQAVRRFVAQVRQVGDAVLDADEPARTWLSDWETLIRVREEFAAGGFAGAFAVPVDQDAPLTRRMNDIGVDECVVPQSLTTSP